MSKSLALAVLPALGLLAACGGDPANELTTTNTGNVILNDAQANMSFENDAIPNTQAEDMNAAMGDNAVATDGTYGGMTNADDAMMNTSGNTM